MLPWASGAPHTHQSSGTHPKLGNTPHKWKISTKLLSTVKNTSPGAFPEMYLIILIYNNFFQVIKHLFSPISQRVQQLSIPQQVTFSVIIHTWRYTWLAQQLHICVSHCYEFLFWPCVPSKSTKLGVGAEWPVASHPASCGTQVPDGQTSLLFPTLCRHNLDHNCRVT